MKQRHAKMSRTEQNNNFRHENTEKTVMKLTQREGIWGLMGLARAFRAVSYTH